MRHDTTPAHDDDHLIRLLASSRRAAQEQGARLLYRRHRVRLLNWFRLKGACTHSGDAGPTAGDMLQAWMMKAWSNARQYQGSDQPGAATAWLNKLAASAMADEWRRWSTRFTEHDETQTREVRGDDVLWEHIAQSHADEDADNRAEALRRRHAVQDALGDLARHEADRAAVIGMRLDGLPHQAIGRHIGRTPGATRTYYSESCQRLRPLLARRLGMGLVPGATGRWARGV
jgi:DNA-directed RNA polymerase specialized sigma24 family protein